MNDYDRAFSIFTRTTATATSDMLLPFVDVENGNDVGVMPLKLESDKGTT